jgi:hypothetical protein
MPGWGRARLKEGQIPRTTRLEMQQQTVGLPSWGWDCYGRVPRRPDREKAFSSCGCEDPCRSETAVELQAAACEMSGTAFKRILNDCRYGLQNKKIVGTDSRCRQPLAGSNVHQFKTWSGDGLAAVLHSPSEPGQASMCSAGGSWRLTPVWNLQSPGSPSFLANLSPACQTRRGLLAASHQQTLCIFQVGRPLFHPIVYQFARAPVCIFFITSRFILVFVRIFF